MKGRKRERRKSWCRGGEKERRGRMVAKSWGREKGRLSPLLLNTEPYNKAFQ
jgi:hypothetical protein